MNNSNEPTLFDNPTQSNLPARKPSHYKLYKFENEIIQMHNDGFNTVQIAKKFGVHPVSVQKFLNRRGLKPRNIHRTYSLDETAFDNAEENSEAAAMVGLLMADGSIWHKGSRWLINISVKESDVCLIERFRSFLKTNMPICFRDNSHGFSRKAERQAGLCLHSEKLIKSLDRYGVVPRKSNIAKVKILENNPHFWTGVILGDGWVTFKTTGISKRIEPSIGLCGSLELIQQFRAFVRKHIPRFRANIYENGTPLNFKLVITGRNAKTLAGILFSEENQNPSRKERTAYLFKDWMPMRKEYQY